MKTIKYFFIRLLFFRSAKKLKLDFHSQRMLGDIVVTGINDLEYIGKGKYLLVSKEDSEKVRLGFRIDNYLRSGGSAKNQFIIRNKKIIASRYVRKNTNKK
jgi:hypothetical protein